MRPIRTLVTDEETRRCVLLTLNGNVYSLQMFTDLDEILVYVTLIIEDGTVICNDGQVLSTRVFHIDKGFTGVEDIISTELSGVGELQISGEE